MASSASAGTLPAGFQETTAISGLTNPTVVRFAPDGTIYVAEKSGLIKTFDGLSDSTPTVFADLRTEVHNYWDRGLLGMDLSFYYGQGYPWVYVLYTRDAAIGGTPPRWGTAGATSDGCPSPPGPTTDGCVVSGRLARLVPQTGGGVTEEVMVDGWCQQYPSHSVGSIEHDPWGAIYASGGDGASFTFEDYGQGGNPRNPCGDPPVGVGGIQTPPSAEGGSLRSQDIRTPGDPVGLNGSVIRVDPDGNAYGTNPMINNPDANAQRIIASGLRNPFRFDVDDQGELWIGDVGSGSYEEIDRKPYWGFDNFGWPCYEGPIRHGGFDSADLTICETLYGQAGAVASPFLTYHHNDQVVPGESCPTGSSSISGVRFYGGTTFPSAYTGSLFFADYSRDCIWVIPPGTDGAPDASRVATFDLGASNPVWIENGPDGALYYADFDGGRIQRIQFSASNQNPSAVIDADRLSGPPPLTVNFDGRRSSDPDGDSLAYAWDLDNDGAYDDSASPTPVQTFSSGSHVVGLKVSDGHGGTGTATVTVDAGNSPPTPTISTPTPTTTWRVGQAISFSGSALDPEQGTLPATALDWELIMHHCPSNCHTHAIQSYPDRASGSFSAPDHEYPSYLELKLTATDAGGLTASTSVQLNPRTVNLTLASSPSKLGLTLNGVSAAAPFTRTLIEGSLNSISATSPQDLSGRKYTWRKWSDGGARTHNVTVSSSRTITATFRDSGAAGAARRHSGSHRGGRPHGR